ncbi:hypothetical protein [Streptomyces sp. NPDC059171]|uniref:hypothetical protein n=1 Tax=Streptomyces sp. NPDC059171 TaxID=3346755 RepID=UPI00368545D5
MAALTEQQKKILNAVYEEVDGRTDVAAAPEDLATNLSMSVPDMRRDFAYLAAAGLARVDWLTNGDPVLIYLTPQGAVDAAAG